uniref:RGS domain-containing protein n=1 Tax=Spongospora subterranea TaxID=70186 RepID=A0A0H5R8S2_9EUKA|eukprot:CRZ10117.1 hypothetical protein [Spongospora subterranea]
MELVARARPASAIALVAVLSLSGLLAAPYVPVWVLFIALFSTLTSVSATVFLAFVRRSHPPLAQTCLPLAVCAVVSSLLVLVYDVLMVCHVLPKNILCSFIARWAVSVASFASVIPYFILGWRLHVIFHAGDTEPRYVHWMYTISDAGLVRMFFFAISIPMLFTSIEPFLTSGKVVTHPTYSECAEDGAASLIFLLFGNCIALIVLGLLFVSVYRSCQTFGIHNELGLVFFAQTVFVIIYVEAALYPSKSYDPSHFVSVARALSCFAASIAIPLRRSFQVVPPVPIVPRPERALTLSGILSDPLYFTFFHDFVAADNDCCLLEFFIQAKMFPDERDPNARLRDARRIFATYLKRDSPRSLALDVDLNSPEVQKINLLVNESTGPLPDDLFAQPAADVYHQMEHFTLRRFRMSPSYDAMLKEMRRHLLIRERLFFSDMIDERGQRLTVPLLAPDAIV